ncbi:MAG TPA: hypothetical protein VHS03_06625 [Gaiellaceae bacterium]|jgi:hypothetical protein|nr:hypothetical protein [Gaiellaceae bacterium]
MGRWTAAFAVLVAGMAVVGVAGARTTAIHTHYAFSFSVASKPGYLGHGNGPKITGSGRGTFSIAHRQIDRDNTVFWDVVGAKGSFSLASGGKVFVTGAVTGGHFGIETATGGHSTNVSFDVRITSTTRFHCAKPNTGLDLQDLPQVKSNLDGMGFSACTTNLQWEGVAPKLVVHVDPVTG